jgi:hypothetical protein
LRISAQVTTAVGQPSARQLEARIGAEVIKIVGILIAAGDQQYRCSQDVGDAVDDEQRVASIDDQPGEPIGQAEAAFRRREKHHAAIGGDTTAIERSSDFLASDGWELKR